MQGIHAHYVLHGRPYSNTSLLLELLSETGERYPAIAKGVKTRRSALPGLLQPFRPLLIGVSGRGEVRTVTSADMGGQPHPLAGEALYCGFYVNELLLRLLGRNDPHEALFGLYRETLDRLAKGEELEQDLRRFELGLLRALGYGMLLDLDAEGGDPVRPDGRYRYRIEEGPVAVHGPALGADVVSGTTLLALAGNRKLQPLELREARGLMRFVLGYYLEGRPLKSRELFRKALEHR